MDAIFKALNDPARRTLLDSLHANDGQTLSDLEEVLEMTRFGVMKHLKVLEEANLIVTRKDGRFKYHYLNAVPLQEVVDRWVEPLLQQPAARAVTRLKTKLERDNAMSKPDFMMQTYINCTQDALWDALTDPAKIADYSFLATRVEMQGNTLVYYTPDENVMLICTHTTEEPKTRIESTFEPHWQGPDVAMQASRFVYLIAVQGENCQLTLEHYNIPAGQEGVADGWNRTLAGLKTYLEANRAVKFAHHDAEA